jgi:hypothetical protein
MKKILLLIFTATALSSARAQDGFGPEAGILFSTKKIIPPGSYAATSSYIVSGKVGMAADLQLDDHFYLQTGVSFAIKGNKDAVSLKVDSNDINANENIRLYTLEAPLTLVYKTHLQGNQRLFFGLGAYFGYTLGGNDKFHTFGSQPVNGAIQAFDTSSSYKLTPGTYIKAFDMGVDVMAGYELPTGLFFRAWWMVGVVNTSVYTYESDKNRSFGLSAGYYLGKARHKIVPREKLVIKGDE